ncbi:MAG: permease [Aminivibrio sp.]|jgi:uncharacterized membrane protein YraQ (UPF0718 family)|nr:permease [Synergistaceae bacterium]
MGMRLVLKRWRVALAALAITLPLGFAFPAAGEKAVGMLGINIATVMGILPPVFILLGLFDTWVPRERVAPHLGEGSGLKGVALALFLGSASAGPLYVAFPVAEVLLRKGASVRNIFIFIGAWSTMRAPMFLFELQNMGFAFGLSRYAASFVGVLAMAWLTDRFLGEEDRRLMLAGSGDKV